MRSGLFLGRRCASEQGMGLRASLLAEQPLTQPTQTDEVRLKRRRVSKTYTPHIPARASLCLSVLVVKELIMMGGAGFERGGQDRDML